jgi:hypothetical protein
MDKSPPVRGRARPRCAAKTPLVALAPLALGPLALGPLAFGTSFPASARPTLGTAWALGYPEGSPLIPISRADGHLGTTVRVTNGFDDCALAITPMARRPMWQNATNSVVPENLTTGANGPLIGVGQEPTAVAISPDGRTTYVLTGGPQLGGGGVLSIDNATNTGGVYARSP